MSVFLQIVITTVLYLLASFMIRETIKDFKEERYFFFGTDIVGVIACLGTLMKIWWF